MILAVDTTHEFGSLALVHGGRTIEEMPLHSPEGFGHILFGHLDRLLERHALQIGDIGCFAAAAGPGSFTGVRIGLACVKGLAEATGRPVVPVSNLRAMASFGTGRRRVVLLDARRGEIYAGVFGPDLQPLAAEVVIKLPAFLASLPLGVEFIAADFTPFLAALLASHHAGAPRIAGPRALAAAIGAIAESDLGAGLALDPAAVDANYVRRSDAEMLWKDCDASSLPGNTH